MFYEKSENKTLKFLRGPPILRINLFINFIFVKLFNYINFKLFKLQINDGFNFYWRFFEG